MVVCVIITDLHNLDIVSYRLLLQNMLAYYKVYLHK